VVVEYRSKLTVCPKATAGIIGHLPTRSANMPRGILTAIATKDRRLIIIPSSKALAPFCVMYSGRIGCIVSDARNRVIDVPVKR